jgi:dolichyl-phosphate-mannose-protein mannosyltransferase/tetratricopeptide repeat protein
MRSRPIQLGLIVLVGATLRLWGLLHGLADGLVYHADAHLAVWSAWHLHLGGPFREARFGAAHGFLSWLAIETVDLVARGMGYPPEWSFALVGSVLAVLTAVLGTLTIPAVYLLGRRAFGRRVGLVAAAFVAVSPLHTFHSHYPYRDVPMVLALTLTLAACVSLATRPGVLAYAGAAVGAGLTIALKPAGLVVVAPLVAALALAWRRRPSRWVTIATLALLLLLLVGVTVFRTGHSFSPLAGAHERGLFAYRFLSRHGSTVVHGSVRAIDLLNEWLGTPILLAFALGCAVALWRRRRPDLILLAFLVPGFLAAASIPWMDDRFFVYLVPPAAVLFARCLVDAFDASPRRPLARVAIVGVALALLVADLGRSVWHDVLLSLPDTRALAGRWFEAHIPRSTRLAMEGYFPLGINEWPAAAFFDPRRPLSAALAAGDVLVTSSLEHERYLDPRLSYPAKLAQFFRVLPQEAPLMRSFALAPVGFAHPRIAVYATHPPRVDGLPSWFLPRPYDHTWNRGVAFLEGGPYDRDDRTLFLGGAQIHDVVLASAAAVDEVVVFVQNGSAQSRVRAEVGWGRRVRPLQPGEWGALHFRPRWRWPVSPALYHVQVSLLPEGTTALVQIRAGAREIGEAYAAWGHWSVAVPYLERALATRPGDGEVLLLLGTAYRRLGQAADARRVAARLETEARGYVAVLRQLGQTGDTEPPETWRPAFARQTGLDAGLLVPALTREVRIDSIIAQGRLGGDAGTPATVAAVFERGIDRPDVILNGPRGPRPLLYVGPGAYRARFTLRGGAGTPGQPSLVLRVFAERQLLATRAVTAEALGDGQSRVEIPVPFVLEAPPTPLAVQVEATGRGSFAVDRVQIEPDLPAIFRERWRALQALGS